MRTTLSRMIMGIGILWGGASLAWAQIQGPAEVSNPFRSSVESELPAPSVRPLEQAANEAMQGAPAYDSVSGWDTGCCQPCCCDQTCCDCGCYDQSCCDQGWCDQGCCPGQCYCAPPRGMWYSEVQLMFLRAHISDDAVGKLSEKHELSPRFIIGCETPSGLGARARYWTYHHTTRNLDNPDDAVRLEFDVVDYEGTSRFRSERTDLVISGGFRWLQADVEVDDDTVDAEMPGITLAADVRSMIFAGCNSQWSGVCGVRWSHLGGDWEGDSNDLIANMRDDNIVVQELYGGFEYLRHHYNCDLYARLVFEVQNWHSDALGDNSASDSIEFVGPGVHVGATF